MKRTLNRTLEVMQGGWIENTDLICFEMDVQAATLQIKIWNQYKEFYSMTRPILPTIQIQVPLSQHQYDLLQQQVNLLCSSFWIKACDYILGSNAIDIRCFCNSNEQYQFCRAETFSDFVTQVQQFLSQQEQHDLQAIWQQFL